MLEIGVEEMTIEDLVVLVRTVIDSSIFFIWSLYMELGFLVGY